MSEHMHRRAVQNHDAFYFLGIFFFSLVIFGTSLRRRKRRTRRRRRSPGAVPVDAPLWLDLGDAGILHILKAQIFLEMSLVYAHRHGHIAVAVQGGVSSACKPLAAPPTETTTSNSSLHEEVTLCSLTF